MGGPGAGHLDAEHPGASTNRLRGCPTQRISRASGCVGRENQWRYPFLASRILTAQVSCKPHSTRSATNCKACPLRLFAALPSGLTAVRPGRCLVWLFGLDGCCSGHASHLRARGIRLCARDRLQHLREMARLLFGSARKQTLRRLLGPCCFPACLVIQLGTASCLPFAFTVRITANQPNSSQPAHASVANTSWGTLDGRSVGMSPRIWNESKDVVQL